MPYQRTISCAECKVQFTYTVRGMRSAGRRFCTKSCSATAIKRVQWPAHRATCERCGTLFRYKPSKNRRFCSNACRGAWQSSLPYDEWKGKLSNSRENRAIGRKNGMFGKSPPHPGKARPYLRKDGTTVRLRSSWEVGVAQYLDRIGLDWDYEPCRFDLGEKTYVPDFYIPAHDCFWEVKGWFHEKAQAKIAAFRSTYPDIPLVMVTKQIYMAITA